MKKLMSAIILVFSVTIITHAQIPVQQTVDVATDQVPIAVRTALEKDFGLEATRGEWMVHMTRTNHGGKTITEAEWYSFNIGKRKEKKEARYTPMGNLLLNKGLNHQNQPTGNAITDRIQKD